MPSYLASKLKSKQNIMRKIRQVQKNDMAKRNMSWDMSSSNKWTPSIWVQANKSLYHPIKKGKLLSIAELREELEAAQKQELTEYVERNKIYMKSMYDINSHPF